MEVDQKGVLQFQAQRMVSALCKSFLTTLEDLQEEYDRYFEDAEYTGDANLAKGMPENFLNDKHFNHLRKRILDKGGDVTRDFLEELDKYQVRLLTNEELQEQTARKNR